MVGEFVILYGLSRQSGECPKTVQISPVVASQVVVGEIYRPNPLQRLLRKPRAVPVIIIQQETKKEEKTK